MTSNQVLLPKNARQIFIKGPCGVLDTLELTPKETKPLGIAIIFHPDPKAGGTYTNKVVQSIAKVMNAKGYLCFCPNLRGVGSSDGEHDFGNGETQDGLAIAAYAKEQYGDLPLVLAGFSFGTAVASAVAAQIPHQYLILIGPAVTRYSVTISNREQTLVIHGQDDEVISLADVFLWAEKYDIPVSVFIRTGHFFHGKLVQLQGYLTKMLNVDC